MNESLFHDKQREVEARVRDADTLASAKQVIS